MDLPFVVHIFVPSSTFVEHFVLWLQLQKNNTSEAVSWDRVCLASSSLHKHLILVYQGQIRCTSAYAASCTSTLLKNVKAYGKLCSWTRCPARTRHHQSKLLFKVPSWPIWPKLHQCNGAHHKFHCWTMVAPHIQDSFSTVSEQALVGTRKHNGAVWLLWIRSSCHGHRSQNVDDWYEARHHYEETYKSVLISWIIYWLMIENIGCQTMATMMMGK